MSVDVFPAPPDTWEEIAQAAMEEDLKSVICCENTFPTLNNSRLPSLRSLAQRVRKIFRKVLTK